MLAAALMLSAAPLVGQNEPSVALRGVATVGEQEVILDVFADAGAVPLRSFGFAALFDPTDLAFLSGGRYAGLWFLRGEDGVSHAYTDITLPASGVVRVVGGRLDGAHAGDGVAGDQLLLATQVFQRLNGSPPKIVLELASPPPYVNFAAAEGGSLDEVVDVQEVVSQAASEDIDGDGLPDDYEWDTFGNLTTSDGTGDHDGDGDPDRDEWLRGTDPTDPDSRFVLQVIPQGDGSKLVIWTGQLGRVYDLEWSGQLSSFGLIGTGLPGVAPMVEWPDTLHTGEPAGFYRVITRYPTMGR